MTDGAGGEDAEGFFNYEGWLLRGGAEGVAGQFASAHESHHKQLADSTAFGFLVRTLFALDGPTARCRAFNGASLPVQEAFAVWAPAAALGVGRASLVASYPAYAPHWDAMERALAGARGAYLRLHAAHAVARVAMQSPAIEVALDRGLRDVTLSDVPLRLRPDHRFRLLQRSTADWSAVGDALDERLRDDPRWPRLREAPALAADMFDPGLRDVWAAVNDAAYAACAEVLRGHSCATLSSEGHREEIAGLVEAARAISPAFDLSSRPEPAAQDTTMLVLANAETETFVSGPLNHARLLPDAVAMSEMVTGPADEHLLLDIRRGDVIADGFDFGTGPRPDRERPAVHLRRGDLPESGLRVNFLDAAGRTADELTGLGAPVYALVDVSLFDASLRRRWGDLLAPGRAALVVDVSLATHLPIWLANPSSRMHYAFMRTEVQGRPTPFLLAHVETEGSRSHLLLRAMSPPNVRVVRAAFDELTASGMALVSDERVATVHEPLLGVALAHLAVEERVFGLAGQDRRLP